VSRNNRLSRRTCFWL